MRNDWLHFKDLEGGSSLVLPTEPFILHSFTARVCWRITSMVDISLLQSRSFHVPGSLALQESFNCMSRFAGSVVFLFNGESSSNLGQKIAGNLNNGLKSGSSRFSVLVKQFSSRIAMKEHVNPVLLNKVAGFMMRLLCREAERLQSLPMLSIAAVLVPPMDNLSLNVLDGPLESADEKMSGGTMGRRPCEVGIRGCAGLLFPDFHRIKYKVEPRTGIEFPMVLDNLDGEPIFSSTSEILVGTGSRTMKIVKIKSLKVYAYGFYIHPDTVCEKLGSKYASLSVSELNTCNSFYEDLLREDIGMTVRLVVNCNGMKINTVRDAFEKSLRSRLLKTNPNTDYDCLNEFGSIFTNDIALPVGTTIDFHRTANGNLVTEIGGSKIGAVQSKDLCRAFFDMYIGDVPISEQTKEEIGKNVVDILRMC